MIRHCLRIGGAALLASMLMLALVEVSHPASEGPHPRRLAASYRYDERISRLASEEPRERSQVVASR